MTEPATPGPLARDQWPERVGSSFQIIVEVSQYPLEGDHVIGPLGAL
jgi:hypothetical protein